MRIDVHQHLLSQPLLAALERRGAVPSLSRSADGWTYHLAGEPDSALPAADADARERTALLDGDGVDRALVLLSSALGIEHLPAEEAQPLLDAWHDGAAALPAERFGAWAAIAVDDPDPALVGPLLARDFVGLSLPATALATPAAVERLGPLLEGLERSGAPLFVHPGPVALGGDPHDAGAPSWWPGMTGYVAQMNAAWHAFLHAGRPQLPNLRVLWAMLAGLAPLQLERLAARGGPAERAADDPLTFYDTSSYGPQAIAAALRAIGPDQLVHGSDRPVVGAAVPPADTALGHALLRVNPARLLSPTTPSNA